MVFRYAIMPQMSCAHEARSPGKRQRGRCYGSLQDSGVAVEFECVQVCSAIDRRVCRCIYLYSIYTFTYPPTYLPTYIHTYTHACCIHTCCTDTNTHAHMHTLIYIYTHVGVYNMNIHIQTYTTPTCNHASIHACMRIYMHLYTYIHTSKPTHIHTYIHTYDIPTYNISVYMCVCTPTQ